MAKVFSVEELEIGHIPRLDDFEKAAHGLIGLCDDPEFTGSEVMIYGSVDERRHDIRSDLDCLVVLPDELAASGFWRFTQALRAIHEETHVPVEPIIVSRSLAEGGQHGIDSLFVEYLQEVEPNVRLKIGNPASALYLAEKKLEEDYHAFVSAKFEKFSKAAVDADTVNYGAFQRALELPRALERKAARLMLDTDDTRALFSGMLGVAYNELIGCNDEYNTHLQKFIDSERTERDLLGYDIAITELYPRVLRPAVTLSLGSHAIVSAN